MLNNIETNDINQNLKRNQHNTEQKIINIACFLDTEILSYPCFVIKKPIISQ